MTWVEEQVAEVHFGKGGTCEGRGNDGVVQSRLNFAEASRGSGCMVEGSDWLLSDHDGVVVSSVVGDLLRLVDREVVD